MNSSYFHTQSWATGSTAAHLSFSDVHLHLEDHSHLFDDEIQGAQPAAEPKGTFHQQGKAKVLFQFFDGWPMTES